MSQLLVAQRALTVPGWAKDALWRRAQAIPSLDLRFADSKSLVDATTGAQLVTFTRASSGTFTGSDGVLQTAVTDAPRFDHNPTTGESLGLLVEEQRTNLLLRSEEFDNASWTKTASSVTANVTTAPDGASTADLITEDTATSTHVTTQGSLSFTSGTTYTVSCFVKRGTGSRNAAIALRAAAFSGAPRVNIDLSTGATTLTGSGGTIGAQAYPNGWWRVSVTATATATATSFVDIGLVSGASTLSYAGDGTSGIYLWGAQLEAGAFPTSYIPTTTATVTRAADVASITGTNFSSFYNQTEGTVFADYGVGGGTQIRYPLAISDNTAGNRITLFNSGSTTLNARVSVANVGTNPGSLSVFAAGASKVALAVAAANNGAIAASNGGLSTAASPAAMPVVDRAYIGLSHNGAEPLNGSVKRLTYWPTRLPNSTLQAVTQ